MFAAADSIQRQIYVTSKHRAAFVPELSKQTSRDTAPFFVQNPTPNSGASIQGFPERLSRHMKSPLPLDKAVGRNDRQSSTLDRRDYNPKTYTELHPKSSVSIGKAPDRSTTFGGGSGSATAGVDTMIDPFKHPKWGTSDQSSSLTGTMTKGSREQGGAFTPPRSRSALDVTRGSSVGGPSPPNKNRRSKNLSYYSNEVEKTLLGDLNGGGSSNPAAGGDGGGGESMDRSRKMGGSASRRSRSALNTMPDPTVLESKYSTAKGGTIPKSDARAEPPAPDRPNLKPNINSISREMGTVSLGRGAGRKEPGRDKQAASYLPMFRLPPPGPLAAPEKRRLFGGYALQRYNGRGTDINVLLRAAESDVKRSKSCMDQYFKIERSQLRTNLLYTPNPNNSAQVGSGDTTTGAGETPTAASSNAARYSGHGI